jgi:DNA (cytosine-5)-methyltransferase 1
MTETLEEQAGKETIDSRELYDRLNELEDIANSARPPHRHPTCARSPLPLMRLLDLFCGGGGGAAMGYHRAGWEVVGVDNQKQGNYPFTFVRGDALQYLAEHGHEYDAIHASPPCQLYTRKDANWGRKRTHWLEHPDLIGPTREGLEETGLPYVIENVPGAPIRTDLMLCGTMFDETNIKKHRLFEANWQLPRAPRPCGDHSQCYNPWSRPGRNAAKLRAAMGIGWLPISGGASRKAGYTGDLFNAIPPAYTNYIGRALLETLRKEGD